MNSGSYSASELRTQQVSIRSYSQSDDQFKHHCNLAPPCARLQWCLNLSGWNHADWGRIVFNKESRFHLCPDVHRRRVWRRPEAHLQQAHRCVDGVLRTILLQFLLPYSGLIFHQDNAKPHTTRVAMYSLTAYQTLPWPARSADPSPIEHVWDMMGRLPYLPGNVDDLARQLDQIWQELTQETIRVLYHSMSCRVAGCIQARGGPIPY
ncbi:transposable element Tc1 transposase [Trichonephila clavipes]|nr:transposable element Tc1 transposase [Trichonephila clavipes]